MARIIGNSLRTGPRSLMAPAESDKFDVTVRIMSGRSTQMMAGVAAVALQECQAASLDPEAENEYELGRPELLINLLNYTGMVKRILAWVHTTDGQQVVVDQSFKEARRVNEGDLLSVVGHCPEVFLNERQCGSFV